MFEVRAKHWKGFCFGSFPILGEVSAKRAKADIFGIGHVLVSGMEGLGIELLVFFIGFHSLLKIWISLSRPVHILKSIVFDYELVLALVKLNLLVTIQRHIFGRDGALGVVHLFAHDEKTFLIQKVIE